MKQIIIMICALCVAFQAQGMTSNYQSPPEDPITTIENKYTYYAASNNSAKAQDLMQRIDNKDYKILLDCAIDRFDGHLAFELIKKGTEMSASNTQKILESPYTFNDILKEYKYKICFKVYQPLKRFSRTFLMGLLTPVSQYRAVNWLWNFFWGYRVIDNARDKGNDMKLTKGQLTSISLLEGTFFIGGILGRYYVVQKALDKLLTYAPQASLTKKYQDIYPKPLAFMKYVTLFLLSKRVFGALRESSRS